MSKAVPPTTTKPQNNGNNASTQAPAPEFGEYNGKPTIILRRSVDDRYPFMFGQGKAKLIIANLEAIRQFAAGN